MNIAIVDDAEKDALLLKRYIEKYSTEKKQTFKIYIYMNGLDFLNEIEKNFDIIFMDIEMPHINGIETAKKLREIDETAILIFITNMAQYAIHGYEVNAIEFMVKPVGYYNFSDKMSKALKFVKRDTEKVILLKNEETLVKIPISNIYYLEKDKNYIIFHTQKGDYKERGSMTQMEEKLKETRFSKCIAGCLVNLQYVSKISKDEVFVNNICLPISRKQKKQFVKDFTDFLGGELI